MITGFATLKGTSERLKRCNLPNRESTWFYTSPIAHGTHLGDMNAQDSARYMEAMRYGMANGINFIDTAINYRGMRSERDVGKVLKEMIEKGLIERSEMVISTKGGIIPGDIEANLIPKEYLQKVLIEGNIIQETDLNRVHHQRHVLNPSYYEFAIHESRKHLNLETIDIYYIHNPEISMTVLGPEAFYRQLHSLFSFLEHQVKAGHIKHYGLATWFGLIKDPAEEGFISIEKVLAVAKNVAGEDHHFHFIQFPLNQHMNAGINHKNQEVRGKWLSVLEAARELGIFPTTSAPFNLGNVLVKGTKPSSLLLEVTQNKGILSTMVGMKKVEHVKENMGMFRYDDK
ncbi:aldo/keto reductase [Rossellomorea sp. AcN35-11]|nr:aldo/keto reductase [Rossellomorea aquimaris]WJV31162.1 aldo/keto reductase [Rossellomorea sp. AcN35-11]